MRYSDEEKGEGKISFRETEMEPLAASLSSPLNASLSRDAKTASGHSQRQKTPLFAPGESDLRFPLAPPSSQDSRPAKRPPPPPRDYISAPMGEFGLLAEDEDGKQKRPHSPSRRRPSPGALGRSPVHSLGSPPRRGRSPRDHGCFVVANPDLFFLRAYLFFAGKGLVPILTLRIVNLITLAFTVFLTTFLVGFVKWDLLVNCHDEHTCLELQKYLTTSAITHPNLYQRLVFLYAFLFGLYWVHELLGFLGSVSKLLEMDSFYRDFLKISPKDIISIEWNVVVQRIIALQKNGQYRFSNGQQEVTAHDIACRIMRKENYLIAMLNKNILDLSVPLPFIGPRFRGTAHARTESLYLTRTLEWSIYHCVLNHMFTNKFGIRKEFQENVSGLQARFVAMGIGHVVLLPFVLFFMVTMFFLKNAQEWHADRSYLGPREWSPYAKWIFREYNELPHFFERRLNRSYKFANNYTSGFQSPLTQVLARCIRFLSGSLVSVLLLLTLIDDSIALHIKFYDHNVLWYIGVLGGLFAASSSMVRAPDDRVYDPEETMMKVATYTHYLPDHWRGQFHMLGVRQEFTTLFQHKIHLFGLEVFSLVFAPLILCFSLPKCAQSVVDFVREHTSEVDEMGAVCDYSLFDFAKYGNATYASPAGYRASTEASNQGKMEKSFINFKTNHPDWDCDAQGKQLMDNLSTFQQSLCIASTSRLDSIQEETPSPPQLKSQEGSATSVDTDETEVEEGPEFALPSMGRNALNLDQSLHTMSRSVQPQVAISMLRQSFLGPEVDVSLLRNVLGEEQATDITNNSFYWLEQYCASSQQGSQVGQSFRNSDDEVLNQFHTAYV